MSFFTFHPFDALKDMEADADKDPHSGYRIPDSKADNKTMLYN